MNSLQQLNSNGYQELEFTDTRTGDVIFDRVTPTNQTDTSYENNILTAKVGIEIVQVINWDSANVTYTINVSSLAGTTVSWATVPSGITIQNPSSGIYLVTGDQGVKSRTYWDIIKAPTITTPYGYFGTFAYTSTITYNSTSTKSWTTTVTIEDVQVFLPATAFNYATNASQIITGTPYIQSEAPTPGVTWTITVTPSQPSAVTTLSSAGSGGTSSFNSSTKVLTIVGLKAQAQSHLDSITLVSNSNLFNYTLTYYASNSTNGVTDSKTQSLSTNDALILAVATVPNENYTAAAFLVNGGPKIVDAGNDGTGTYTLTVTPTNLPAVEFINPNGGTAQYQYLANDFSATSAGDNFGASVAMSPDGNTMAASSPYDDYSTYTNAGSVYIYTRNGTGLVYQAKLTPSDPINDTNFGFGATNSDSRALSFSQDGNRIAILRTGTTGTRSSLYIFTRTGTAWAQEAKLEGSDWATYNANIGCYSCSMNYNGDTVILGASELTNATDIAKGAVYVFTRSGTTWSQQAKLEPSDRTDNDRFGRSVDINYVGDVATIYSYDIAGASTPGAVYVFTRSGSTWSQLTKITPVATQVFYPSVSMSKNGLNFVVWSLNTSTNLASVNIYINTAGTWSRQATLPIYNVWEVANPPPPSAGTFTGSLSMSYDGNVISMGAVDAYPQGFGDGAVYINTRSGTTWSIAGYVTGQIYSDGTGVAIPAQGDGFGQSHAMSQDGTTIIIGMPRDEGTFSGTVQTDCGRIAFVNDLTKRSFVEATKVLSITGTRNVVNGLIDNFWISQGSGANSNYFLNYTVTTPSSVTVTRQQSVTYVAP